MSNSSQPNLVEDLPLVPKELLFSFLPVRELKNLRLVSSRLSSDVLQIDKRFRIITLKSSENLPDVLYSKNTTVCLDLFAFEGCTTKLFDWMKLHSSVITSLRLQPSDYWDQLLSPDLEFPEIKKVELNVIDLDGDYIKELFSKYGPHINILHLWNGNYQDTYLAGSLDLSSLKVLTLNDVDGLIQILMSLESSTKSLEVLHIEAYGQEIEMPVFGEEFQNLRNVMISFSVDEDLGKIWNLTEFLEKCSKTLNVLELDLVDTSNIALMQRKFKTLQKLIFMETEIKMSQLNNIICESSQVLESLYFEDVDIEMDSEPAFELPCLINLTLKYLETIDWIVARFMKTLTKLDLYRVDLPELNQDLPVMREVLMGDCGGDINILLGRCPNLETLKLYQHHDYSRHEEIKLLSLKQLTLSHQTGTCMASLLSSCGSSLEILSMSHLSLELGQELDLELSALEMIHMSYSRGSLNTVLKKCPNLKTLFLNRSEISDYQNFEAKSLKNLVFDTVTETTPLGTLINTCKSQLETLVFDCTDLSILDGVEGKLTNLKRICISPPPSEEKIKLLKELYLPDDVQVHVLENLDTLHSREKFTETGEWCFEKVNRRFPKYDSKHNRYY